MNAHLTAPAPADSAVSAGPRAHSGWKQQFAHPAGTLGRGAGFLMAVKNAPQHELALEMLEVTPEDRVLEIGFGPGRLIERLAERATHGFVAGVDVSALMVEQVTRGCRDAIGRGQISLRQSSVSLLPYADGRFTKVCAVNSFHLWPEPEADLVEVRRVMADGGLLLLCVRTHRPTRNPFAPPGFTETEIEHTEAMLRRAGFQDVRTERRRLAREIACVLARR